MAEIIEMRGAVVWTGIRSASISKAGIGALLGLSAGTIGELSRFATVLVRQLKGVIRFC